MAKGQKRSNREVRKPKQARPKSITPPTSFRGLPGLGVGMAQSGPKDARK